MRETFQRGLSAGAAGGEGSVGGGGDEGMGTDDDSPPSGPDAGGIAASSLFPPAEWQVMASSAQYSVSQVDFDRCSTTSSFGVAWRLLSPNRFDLFRLCWQVMLCACGATGNAVQLRYVLSLIPP